MFCTFTRSLPNRKHLVYGSSPCTTVDELLHTFEAAWVSVPGHDTQSLFDSIPSRKSAVITAREKPIFPLPKKDEFLEGQFRGDMQFPLGPLTNPVMHTQPGTHFFEQGTAERL
ncbi:hypothetical protein TNCV_4549891 [Trichonephila clavipes]|nr:hypothetical protein TNCV_4549891 [Trichonephila clavipes]